MVDRHFTLDVPVPARYIIGCDEVGRGCLAGDVVAAAVVLPAQYDLPHMKDSKELGPMQRHRLAIQIRAQALAWSLGRASAQEIDAYNILQASFIAMHRAIAKLLLRYSATHLLIDGNRFRPYSGLAHLCIVRGDATVPAISAASILAKTYRDQYMRELAIAYPAYGWERNVGYPTPEHRLGIAQEGITPHHRLSFKL